MKHLFTKLIFGFLILIIVYSTLILIYNFNATKDNYIANFERDLKNLNISISEKISPDIKKNDTTNLRNYIRSISKTLMVRITVINKHGVVLADSRANPNTMENHLNRPEIQDALKKHLGKETRFSNTLKHDFLYVATPIYLKDELVGFIRTSYYLDYINALFNKLIYDLLKIVTVISLILLAGVYFFARRITIPLSKLSGAVKEVAEGNFETQVIVQSKDEIGELSENFNIMSKKLKILFDEVNKQKEESKRLEKIKKDFITNVSHELKTPLTAIKGFIETLEDEIDDPDNKHYIEIISRNTDRLINIVQDLLLLTELEDEAAANKLMLSNVDIRIILENVRLLFTQKLIEKGLYFKIMADDNLPNVFVDSYRFEQLFINLLSNSIKYTENGGITIELKKSESKFIIICSDTGVGIPLEDQDRIFERFYISEKSRSRKYDGTGIGLSIVKHILMLHNGTIELDKEYRNGTRFIITI